VVDRKDLTPAVECFEGMVLVAVLKSTQHPGKSEDVLQAVYDRWCRVLDPDYLYSNGIKISTSNRATLGIQKIKPRPEAPKKEEAHKKRRSS
jgi:hypothetical protein